jgi:hypothetical protein
MQATTSSEPPPQSGGCDLPPSLPHIRNLSFDSHEVEHPEEQAFQKIDQPKYSVLNLVHFIYQCKEQLHVSVHLLIHEDVVLCPML